MIRFIDWSSHNQEIYLRKKLNPKEQKTIKIRTTTARISLSCVCKYIGYYRVRRNVDFFVENIKCSLAGK